MVQYFPVVTGSLTVNGTLSISGSVSVSGSISGTSSLASNSLLLEGTGSVGFTTTSSYNVASSSLSSRTTQIEQVYATTGSNSFRATQSITGSLTVTGQIIAQTINVQQVTSSIIYSSGSNTFGCDINSRQTFTGSVYITGSLVQINTVCNIGGGALNINGDLRFGGVGGQNYSVINYQGGCLQLGTDNTSYLTIAPSGATLVCGNIGITSTSAKFYQLTNNCKSSDSILDLYNTATNGFGAFIQAGADSNNYALSVTNYLQRHLLYVAGNGNVGIGCGNPNAKLTINNGSCVNSITIYGCDNNYVSQIGWYDPRNVNSSDGVGGQRVALIEIGSVAGSGTGCRGANMGLYTHEANGSLKLPLLLMHTGNVCLLQGNLYTTCTLFAPGTPIQIVSGTTTWSSGTSDSSTGLGPSAQGSTPGYNCGCVITSVNFTPKSSSSKILIQTTNVAMWETANISDHFYLWASNDTAGTVLTKAGSYLQAFGQSNNNGAIIHLNGIANSWGTSANTIAFRAGSTGGGTAYQYNPYYNASGFNADTVGFFSYTIMEIAQ